MDFIVCDDDITQRFAYNVYHCRQCSTLAKEDVWKNEGVIWIMMDGKIERTSREKETANNND